MPTQNPQSPGVPAYGHNNWWARTANPDEDLPELDP